jgi:hypothetical protein
VRQRAERIRDRTCMLTDPKPNPRNRRRAGRIRVAAEVTTIDDSDRVTNRTGVGLSAPAGGTNGPFILPREPLALRCKKPRPVAAPPASCSCDESGFSCGAGCSS